MNMAIDPESDRLIAERIKTGRYSTPASVVQAALVTLADLESAEQLTPEDLAAIAEADAEADRGEGVTLENFRIEIGRRFKAQE